MKYSQQPIEGEQIYRWDLNGYHITAIGVPSAVIYSYGISACSPQDSYSRKLGLTIARGRARKAMGLNQTALGPRVDALRIYEKRDWVDALQAHLREEFNKELL